LTEKAIKDNELYKLYMTENKEKNRKYTEEKAKNDIKNNETPYNFQIEF
jgi:hypothetical protein